MRQLLAWVLTAVVFAAVGGLCVWRVLESREHAEAEPQEVATGPAEAAEQPPLSVDEQGCTVITFDRESQVRAGLTIAPLAPAVHQPELAAYGVLTEDPAWSFTLRAPISGMLVDGTADPWPVVGRVVKARAVLGTIEPRLTPLEQVDVHARLTTAEGEVEASRATLDALRKSYETKRALHAQQGIVSDEVLRDAEARVRAEEARLKAAEETVRLLRNTLSTATRPAEGLPLEVPVDGKVVELSAHPGEAVEAGQTLLRVMHADRLLARVSLPAGQRLDEPAAACRLVVAGHEDRLLDGGAPVLAASAEGTTGGQTFLTAVAAPGPALQPGTPVTAYLPRPGEPMKGLVIPRSAVIRHGGRAWAYVRTAEDAFTRRPVAVDAPTEEGWFVTEGFQAAEPVVVGGAQSLLSREMAAVAAGGEEEEE